MGCIRLLLALTVVVAHCGDGTLFGLPFSGVHGFAAVECFFIISGFYMSLVINDKYGADVRRFYGARFIRLAPIYLMTFLLFLLLQGLSFVAGKPMGAFAAFERFDFAWWEYLWAVVANLFVVGSDAITLYGTVSGSPANGLLVIGVVWTLGIEIAFYALAPFILRRGISTLAMIFIAFSALRWAVWSLNDFQWSSWNYFFAPAAMPFFVAGALAHRIYQLRPWCTSRTSQVALWLTVSLVICFEAELLPVADKTLLYILITLAVPAVFALTKNWRWERQIGELSYPVYLVHGGILSIYSPFRHFVPEEGKVYVVAFGSIALSVGLLWVETLLRFPNMSGSRPAAA
jgi:peptidoglycan/LPS O-acetylase OafA/YrhL